VGVIFWEKENYFLLWTVSYMKVLSVCAERDRKTN